jgi:hypothetical protein
MVRVVEEDVFDNHSELFHRSNFACHIKYLIFNNGPNVFDDREIWAPRVL